jgi:hypothetical protein
MNRGILNTVRDSALSLGKILKKINTPLLLIVQFTTLTTENTFTRQIPALYYNCFVTPAVTADVYKQHTAACQLLLAATI